MNGLNGGWLEIWLGMFQLMPTWCNTSDGAGNGEGRRRQGMIPSITCNPGATVHSKRIQRAT